MVVLMPTYAERILRIITTASRPMDDDEIAMRMGIVRQNVNQTCRRLEAQGLVRRQVGPTGKIVNRLVAEPGSATAPAPRRPAPAVPKPSLTTEDDVKKAVRDHFQTRGLHVEVKWGRDRGIDIIASGPDQRWIVEAKGEVASDQQQGSYFLGALGELIQRMDDPHARYAIALPDNRRYRGLADRLPDLARRRLALTFLFVDADGTVTECCP